jgi:hypothetical protein
MPPTVSKQQEVEGMAKMRNFSIALVVAGFTAGAAVPAIAQDLGGLGLGAWVMVLAVFLERKAGKTANS